MKIGPKTTTEMAAAILPQKKQQPTKQQTSETKDSVEISQSGREKLKTLADSLNTNSMNLDGVDKNLSPKLARIKNKVEAGYYDMDNIQNNILDKLADNIFNDIDNTKHME